MDPMLSQPANILAGKRIRVEPHFKQIHVRDHPLGFLR